MKNVYVFTNIQGQFKVYTSLAKIIIHLKTEKIINIVNISGIEWRINIIDHSPITVIQHKVDS